MASQSRVNEGDHPFGSSYVIVFGETGKKSTSESAQLTEVV